MTIKLLIFMLLVLNLTSFSQTNDSVSIEQSHLRKFEYPTVNPFNSHYQRGNFSKYNKQVQSDTIYYGYTEFKYDSISIHYRLETDLYKIIFSTGLLYPEILYCAMDTNCIRLKDPYDLGKGDYIISVDLFEEIQVNFNNNKEKHFRLWVSPSQMFTSVDYKVIYLEISNKDANDNSTFEEFISGSEVTFLKVAKLK